MKNLTVSLAEDLFQALRIRAAEEGKSMSRLVAETIELRLGKRHPMSQSEAMARFLAGPDMDLLTGDGRAPTRAELYD